LCAQAGVSNSTLYFYLDDFNILQLRFMLNIFKIILVLLH